MSDFVQCWQCIHFIWGTESEDNLSAVCDIKRRYIPAKNEVCEDFYLKKGINTKREIPSYCKYYNRNYKPRILKNKFRVRCKSKDNLA